MALLHRKQPVLNQCAKELLRTFVLLSIYTGHDTQDELHKDCLALKKLTEFARVNSPEKMLSSRDGGVSQIGNNVRVQLMISEENKKKKKTRRI